MFKLRDLMFANLEAVSAKGSDVKHMPTINDVARLAGVSTATVSRSLNFPDMVRPQTRQVVEDAVRELGYTPNFSGQSLASSRTNTIGAIIPTMDNSIFARGLQSLQEALADAGITLLVATSQYSPQREESQIRTMLARGVDGLVLIGDDRDEKLYALLQSRQTPYVLLWTARPGSPHVTIGFDNFAAASNLTQRVIGFGHHRIAMIAGITEGNDRARDRVRGVRHALRDAGLTIEPRFLTEAPYSIDAGEVAAAAMLSQRPRPTAILCGNDVLAAGVLRAARRAGLSVPRDISIVGFDDIDLANAVDPPLTTVRVPHRRMGSAAAKSLIEWVQTGIRPESLVLTTEIVARQSLDHVPSAAPPPLAGTGRQGQTGTV